MTKEEQQFFKRILEYADNCFQRDIPVYSDFMNLNEQTIFHSAASQFPPVRYELTGGYEPAERKIVCFLPSYMQTDEIPTPIRTIRIMPVNKKFAESLTHRDYLGAIMNLGIERCKTGDILIGSDAVYLMCVETMASYIIENLITVRHTSVSCTLENAQNFQPDQKYEEIEGSVASERIDGILAMVYRTSRSKITPLIAGEKVFVSGRLVVSPSQKLKAGDIVSVRGLGKFEYVGFRTQTKKGRLYAAAKKYC